MVQPRKYKIRTTRDRAPELSILPILHQYAGQSIKIVVYRKGKPRHFAYIKKGEHAGERYKLRQQYDLPEAKKDINNLFRGKHHQGFFWDWKTKSDDPDSYHLQVGDEIHVTSAVPIEHGRVAPQRFRQGMQKHCVFQHLISYGESKLEAAQNDSTLTKNSKKSLTSRSNNFQIAIRIFEHGPIIATIADSTRKPASFVACV